MSRPEAFLHHSIRGLCHVAQPSFLCFAAPSGYECPKGSLAVLIGFSSSLPRSMYYVGIISVNPFLIPTPLLTKDFILIVWLCAYLVVGPLRVSEEWEIVEFFSGTGRISRLAAKAGLTCASYEIQLAGAPKKKKKNKRHFPRRSPMDFNGECGFAFLGFAERKSVGFKTCFGFC